MRCIFLISGKMRSGKDTLGEYLFKHLTMTQDAYYGPTMESFAGELKKRCYEDFFEFAKIMNSKVDELQAVASSLVSSHYSDMATAPGQLTALLNSQLEAFRIVKDSWYDKKTALSRALIQTYGTDIIRDRISSSYWADFLVKKTRKQYGDVIVTDLRFENEAEAFYEAYKNSPVRITTIRVIKDVKESVGAKHSSETSLTDEDIFEYIVDNNGTLDDLWKAAGNIVKDVLTFS